jgi:hypothetical protein
MSLGKTGEYCQQNMDKKVSSLKWTILCWKVEHYCLLFLAISTLEKKGFSSVDKI